MGHVRHHAIVVTCSFAELAEKARRLAVSIFGKRVSEILTDDINGYSSFFVPPDGSKEGWDESDVGDSRREKFRDWLDDQRYFDGSSSYGWVEVEYGGDDQSRVCVRGQNVSERTDGKA